MDLLLSLFGLCHVTLIETEFTALGREVHLTTIEAEYSKYGSIQYTSNGRVSAIDGLLNM